jgi:hypothetical protein
MKERRLESIGLIAWKTLTATYFDEILEAHVKLVLGAGRRPEGSDV